MKLFKELKSITGRIDPPFLGTRKQAAVKAVSGQKGSSAWPLFAITRSPSGILGVPPDPMLK